MNFVLFNGLGLILNIAGFLILATASDPGVGDGMDKFQAVLGIVIFMYGILLHTHWWKPLCHLYAAVCYVVGFYGAFNWGEDQLAGALFFFSAMIIHWQFWIIAIIAMKIGAWISRQT